MKVSLRTVEQLIGATLPPVDELVKRVNEQLGGVEEIINLAEKYRGAVIVKVISAEKHPDADRLTVCLVDDGHAIEDVERDEDGYVQVVCGAPNVHADMWAVWLPPRVTVPSTYGTSNPLVLDSRKLRGVMSHGMLAAGDELALNSNHDGIVELTPADLPPELSGRGLATGQDFAEVFGLDDTIIDIENKMFTHRPDCFGQLGVAREIAGILGHKFESPEWYQELPVFSKATGLDFTATNDALEQAPRLTTVALDGIEVAPSPLWLQVALVRWGSKAINNVVDATNYVMLMTGQPTHAYDYDKLRGHKLGIRMAQKDEPIELLNGKKYTLTTDDIVIVDGEGPIGLAGVMGGLDSEVTSATTRVVLEVANFDMYAVRKTSMRHGLFTDAVTRFNKGQSPLQTSYVLRHLMDIIGGEQASEVYDIVNDSVQAQSKTNEIIPTMTVVPQFIRERLGVDMKKHDMVQLLDNVEFPLCEDCGWNPDDAEDNDDDLHVNVPFWRTDIGLAEDVVEEIGRLYGFDKLPHALPRRSSAPAPKNATRELKERVRNSLARAGANEVLTYSFIHENVLTRADQNPDEAFRLSNALSPDLQYYRLSVLPSLLDKVHANIKLGYDEFTLFEIGKSHNKNQVESDGLPKEMEMLAAVYASKKPQEGAAYYHVRRLVTQLAADLGFTLSFKPIADELESQLMQPFEPSRSALVESRQGEPIGIIGELKASVRRGFKLPEYTAAMCLGIGGLKKSADVPRQHYQPLSRYPSTTQDISLKTSANVTYDQLFRAVWDGAAKVADNVDIRISPISIYQADDDQDHKTTTLRLTCTDYDKTLTDDDVARIIDAAADAAKDVTGAERI